MIHLERVAKEIKSVGLYDLILQDVQKIVGKARVEIGEILDVLKTHPDILEAYKQTNVEYNLSNIHLRDIPLETLEGECRSEAEKVNEDLKTLREIEKYTLDFEQSSTLVIIFSVEFFVLFSVQYLIVLMDLKEWQWEIYGAFGLSIAVAWWYAKKIRRLYETNRARYRKLYADTLKNLEALEAGGCLKKSELIVESCDEHV